MFYKKAVFENFVKFPEKQGLQSAAKMGLQSVLGWWITKCGNSGLQIVLGVGLQSESGITKCGRVDYKVRQGLQSVVGLQSDLVQQ